MQDDGTGALLSGVCALGGVPHQAAQSVMQALKEQTGRESGVRRRRIGRGELQGLERWGPGGTPGKAGDLRLRPKAGTATRGATQGNSGRELEAAKGRGAECLPSDLSWLPFPHTVLRKESRTAPYTASHLRVGIDLKRQYGSTGKSA